MAKYVFLMIFLLMPTAWADTQKSANITQGDIKVGGSFSFSTTSGQTSSSTTLSLNPTLQYFLRDHFALGGGFNVTKNFQAGGTTQIGFGPVASYYFGVLSGLVPLMQGQITYNHTSAGPGRHDFDSTILIGADYFITPSVAFGPALRWIHVFGNDEAGRSNFQTANSYALVGAFHLYL